MIIEICCGSIESAINAEKGGADRIELCSTLVVGGITPSYGIISETIKRLQIPVFVLIRPRGGDFMYSEAEFESMKQDIEMCKELGCSGIVSGVLLKNSEVDLERTAELIEISKPLPFTFHRAFDWVPDPVKSMKELQEIGAARILTSGQETNAFKGIELLKELNSEASSISILAGAGINSENIEAFKTAGFTEVHTSCVEMKTQIFNRVPMNSPELLSEDARGETTEKLVKNLVDRLAEL